MIYVAYHLNAPTNMSPEVYVPVHVGAATASAPLANITHTDICEGGISHKNRLYSELSLVKYLILNCDDDYIGLAHYRRAFMPKGIADFKKRFPNVQIDYEYGKKTKPMVSYTPETFEYIFNRENVQQTIDRIRRNEVDFVLTEPYKKSKKFGFFSFAEHGWIHMRTLLEFFEYIEKTQTAEMYASCIKNILDNKYHYFSNMLIANNANFKRYSSWLLDLLEGFEQHLLKLEAETGDEYITPRMFGYFSEYLLRPWIELDIVKNNTRVEFVETICFSDLKTDNRV
jgi:hypothetical protein